MPNGAAVRLPRELEPSSIPTTPAEAPPAQKAGGEITVSATAASASASSFDQSLGGAEAWVAAILSALSHVAVRGMLEVREGELSAMTREQGGTLVAALYKMRQTLGEANFVAMMRQQGRLHLNEAVADEVTGMLLEIVSQVDATMRAEMN